MARHDENDWIASDRATHGLCGHMRPAGTPGHLGGDAGIGAGGAEGDGEHDGGDHRLEVGALNADRRGETRVGALEVGVEPLGGLREDGHMWLELCVAVDRRAVVLLPVEPQTCEAIAIAGHGHGTQGGLVVTDVVHGAFPSFLRLLMLSRSSTVLPRIGSLQSRVHRLTSAVVAIAPGLP